MTEKDHTIGTQMPDRHGPSAILRELRSRVFPVGCGAPLVLWQGAFYVGPFVFMVVLTFWTIESYRLVPDTTISNWIGVLGKGGFWSIYAYSLKAAAIASVVVSILAFPCAYVLALKVSTRTRLLGACMLITPFFSSYLVKVQTWRTTLGSNGLLNEAIGYIGLGPYEMVDTLFGTVVGYLTLVFPLVLILQLISLVFVDRRLIEAAHNLGCGQLRVAFAVVIPAARIGLVLAAAFAFVLSFGDFISPEILGGSSPSTMSLLLADQIRGGFQWPRAAVIAVVMVLTLLCVVSAAFVMAYKTGGGKK